MELNSKYGSFMENIYKFRNGAAVPYAWSSWWSNLVKLLSKENWFTDVLSISVGNGLKAKFWSDPWLGAGVLLKDVFPR